MGERGEAETLAAVAAVLSEHAVVAMRTGRCGGVALRTCRGDGVALKTCRGDGIANSLVPGSSVVARGSQPLCLSWNLDNPAN